MARRPAAIPPALRKTLSEWIETDHGDTTGFTSLRCSSQAHLLHAQITHDPNDGQSHVPEPLQPPPGLLLAPLG